MRKMQRADGGVYIYDEDDDQNMLVIEPIITAFTPVNGAAVCICGAPLQPWGWRAVAANGVELVCDRCHRVHGYLILGTKVHR